MTQLRLLDGVTGVSLSYRQHHAHHGSATLPGRLGVEIAQAGLRGRGGAAFPLSTKLDAVRRRRRSPVLVVNGCEGEPLSDKDRALLCWTPHLVLDGAFALARELEADGSPGRAGGGQRACRGRRRACAR